MCRIGKCRGSKGFTLLEIMLAVFIFSLIMTSLVMLLSSSTRTFDKTISRVDTLFQVRGTTEVVSRDLRSVFFFDESSYNVTVRQLRDEIDQRALQIAFGEFDDGSSDPSISEIEAAQRRAAGLLGVASSYDDDDDDDPYLLPPEIDLTFTAKDGGEKDHLSLVTYQPNSPEGYPMPWGLRRVEYYVDRTTLIRTEDDVFKEYIAPDGSIIAKDPPQLEKIAEGVNRFDLKFGYWADGQWLLAEEWHSSESDFRNPDPGLAYQETGLTSSDYNDLVENLPLDNMPAFAILEMSFQPAGRKGQAQHYRKTFRFHASQETAFPFENLLPFLDDIDDARTGTTDSRDERRQSSEDRARERERRGEERSRDRSQDRR